MEKQVNRISRITVRGFKSIYDEQSVEIKPLTILAGANSSGKSSIMQPLLLLKQTLEAPGDPGALLLDGPNVRFTLAEQVLSRIPRKKCRQDFSVRIGLLNQEALELSFKREEGKGFETEQMTYTATDGKNITITPSMNFENIKQILPMPWKTMRDDMKKHNKDIFNWTVRRERCFLSIAWILEEEIEEIPKQIFLSLVKAISPSISDKFIPFIQSVIHLPGLRGNPQRTYPKSVGGPNFPGTFEQYVANVIAQWQSEAGGNGKLADLGAALENMGLTWKVAAKPIDDTQMELRVGRLVHGKHGETNDLISIADVGVGVSQSLPVVVALLAAQPGQLVYLEQPEIHLHPLAQRRLANVLREAVERGVVTVVETHSALLLREVQTLVAQKKLSKDDVALHWVQREEDGSTKVSTADLDEQGAYGNWPEDFDQVELEAEKAYLDAVEISGGHG